MNTTETATKGNTMNAKPTTNTTQAHKLPTGEHMTIKAAMTALYELNKKGAALASSDWTTGTGRHTSRRPLPPFCEFLEVAAAVKLPGAAGKAARRIQRKRPQVRRLVVITSLRQARQALKTWERFSGSDTADGWKDFTLATIAKIEEARAAGFEIVIGNDPKLGERPKYAGRRCHKITQLNSRYHGYSLRTVWAVK